MREQSCTEKAPSSSQTVGLFFFVVWEKLTGCTKAETSGTMRMRNHMDSTKVKVQ